MSFFLNLFFPKQCLECHADGSYLCNSCMAGIDINNTQACPDCRRKNLSGSFCNSDCSFGYHFDRLIVCTQYRKNSVIKKLISSFKYKFCEEMASFLGELLNKEMYLIPNLSNSVFVPVPIHKKRLKFRGFNQTQLLAFQLSRKFDLPLLDCLQRNRFKVGQAKLARKERLKNLKGAISLKAEHELSGKSVILIDDVATTGSTLNECSKVLKESGVKRVYALVLARG